MRLATVSRASATWLVSGLALSVGVLALAAPAEASFPGANGKIAYDTSTDNVNFDVYTVNPDGTGRTKLTTSLAADGDPTWSADGTKIAYESRSTGGRDIYVMNADGSNNTRLTTDPALDRAPTWSPDGSKIAFTSDRSGTSVGIYTMNSNDGSNVTQVTSSGANPIWSPDGSKIAYTCVGSNGMTQTICTIRPDGTDETTFPLPNPVVSRFRADWSPDGTRMVVACGFSGTIGFEVCTMNADGTGITRLTDNGRTNDDFPVWSPNGTKIAFISNRSSDGEPHVWTMNPDGTNPVQVTTVPESEAESTSWQPCPNFCPVAPYDVPQGASSLQVSLVPSFRQTISATQCGARGGTASTHGAPLSLTSCNPPAFPPGTIAHLGPQATGSATYTVVPGVAATPADEADVAIGASLSDVRAGSAAGSDYNPDGGGPDVTLVVKLRISDLYNGASLSTAATVNDLDLSTPVDCADTADPTIGANCAVSTTADAVIGDPNTIKEGNRAVLQVFRALLNDSGVNGTRGDSDDRNFAMQGIYVP